MKQGLLATAVFAGTGYAAYRYSMCGVGVSDEMLRSAAGALSSISVTMLGFMLAVLAILVSIVDRRLIRNMYRTGHFSRLIARLYIASGLFGAGMIASYVALYTEAEALRYLTAFGIASTSAALIMLGFACRSLWMILHLLRPSDGSTLE